MTTIARYIIVLDRMDDDEAVSPTGDWPADDEAGRKQVADELQYAVEQTGQPAGFFRVVARTEVDTNDDGYPIYQVPDEAAHRAARVAILDTTNY